MVFSLIGYKTQEIAISKGFPSDKNRTDFTVFLQPDIKELEQVVVVGYGTAKKRDLTGAIATVSSKDFNKGNFASPDQLIQGKVSGVQIINTNGLPGAATTIKIRGNSAITGAGQPLFVLDGVPLDGNAVGTGFNPFDGSVMESGINPLNFLNAADITSIDVLKDASATAIYGSRAAYGVVIINTRRGQTGQPIIEVGLSSGISVYPSRVKVLDASQYREAIRYFEVNKNNDKGGNESRWLFQVWCK